MKKAIITIGLPASGKSTFIEKLSLSDYIILDPDKENDTDYKIRNKNIAEKIVSISDVCHSIVVMGTGGSYELFKTIDFLKDKQFEITIFYFNTPLCLCLERNKNRSRVVDEKVINNINEYLSKNIDKYIEIADEFYEIKKRS